MSLVMSLQSRGAAHTVSRTAAVVSRFGATTSSMARRLDRYDTLTAAAGVRPTWPTTACVLARHPELLREYADRGIELPLHGLVHGDHAALGAVRQLDTISRAIDLFARSGVRPVGFRGPYLRYNDATLDVLRQLGLRYHCSQAVFFPLHATELTATARARYEQALRLYSARDASRGPVIPRLRDGLVDIPVAVPDDEILIERLALDRDGWKSQWLDILETTYRRGELFTLQLHPERIDELADALAATIAEAHRKRPGVYIARLDEIASWWQRRARFRLKARPAGDGLCLVTLDADEDAVLLARGLQVAGTAWHGGWVQCVRPRFEVRTDRLPIVGISRRSPAEVRRFVAEEGFPLDISDEPSRYGAYVDVATDDWSEADVLASLEDAPGPLVRIWRWPAGARSAMAVTGDIDALTLRDFVTRSWETRDWVVAKSQAGAAS